MNVESKPSVIDLEAMLSPISEEKPAGENLRYSGIYDEIYEARRADEDVEQGEWKIALKIADFRQVVILAVPALTSQTKDLQIAVWLSEALVKLHGFAGLRDGLKLVSGLQDKFWETLFPEIDEGDMEGRANAIEWLALQTSFAIKQAKITQGESYSFFDWEDSKRFDIPNNLETLDYAEQDKYRELQQQADRENRVTADRWRVAIAASRRQFYEEIALTIEECWAECKELNRVIEEKFDRNQMPGLGVLQKSLDEVQTQVNKLLEEKRAEEPDAEAAETGADGEQPAGEGITADGSRVAVSGGAIQSRQEALKRLGQLADFFRKSEPHSPVSYLVQRAVKWGNMPLDSWLQDVIKDQNVLYQLRETLGVNLSEESTNVPQ